MKEFEFEIKPGERLPPETRMEMPEMSYEQELLNTPIPFMNRVEFISDYEKFDVARKSPAEISRNLGITPLKVSLYAQEVGASYDHSLDKYELHTEEVIREELEWEESFERLDSLLSSKKIAEYLGRGVDWVERTAQDLAIYPEYRRMPSGRMANAYPKETAWALRLIMLQYPPANDMYSIEQISELIGKDRGWITKRIEDENLTTHLRVSTGNNAVSLHLDKPTVDFLVQSIEDLPSAAGKWLTVNRMAKLLNRDRKWVAARLAEYQEAAIELLDDTNKVALHYPPEVFNQLEILSENNRDIPVAVAMVTEKTLAQKIGRSTLWVRNRLEHIQEFSEIRKNNQGREYRYYSEEAIPVLNNLESRQSKKIIL